MIFMIEGTMKERHDQGKCNREVCAYCPKPTLSRRVVVNPAYQAVKVAIEKDTESEIAYVNVDQSTESVVIDPVPESVLEIIEAAMAELQLHRSGNCSSTNCAWCEENTFEIFEVLDELVQQEIDAECESISEAFDRKLELKRLQFSWETEYSDQFQESRHKRSRRVWIGFCREGRIFVHASPGTNIVEVNNDFALPRISREREISSWLNGRRVVVQGRKLFWGDPATVVRELFNPLTGRDEYMVVVTGYRQGRLLTADEKSFFRSMTENERFIAIGKPRPWDHERRQLDCDYRTKPGISWKHSGKNRHRKQWMRHKPAHKPTVKLEDIEETTPVYSWDMLLEDIVRDW